MGPLLKILGMVLAYWVFRKVTAQLQESSARPGEKKREWIVRDPVCDTYIPQSRAVSMRVGAQTLYFCSEECRRKHLECAP